MPAYVVAYVKVTDPDSMAAYGSQVEAVTESFGGRYLFVGPGAEVLEGDLPLDGMAIIEFPSREDAQRWYDSPEYAAAARAAPGRRADRAGLTPDVELTR